jgi:hypothetical protein
MDEYRQAFLAGQASMVETPSAPMAFDPNAAGDAEHQARVALYAYLEGRQPSQVSADGILGALRDAGVYFTKRKPR